MGNLIVEADPQFGGGHLSVSGVKETGANFSLVLNETAFSVQSGGYASIVGGDSEKVNDQGGTISLSAGNGTNPMGGSGGEVVIIGGAAEGIEAYGGDIGAGGSVSITGGLSIEGKGGNVSITGGTSNTGIGGEISIVSCLLYTSDAADE